MAPTGIPNSIIKLAKQRNAPVILELDLTDGLIETRPSDPLSAVMSRHQLTVTDVLTGLRLARDDRRVQALVVKVGGRPIGLGLVQELHEAVRRFGESGKPTFAWAETFGEFGAGNLPYYLATAFGTIYLQPSGHLGLTGLAVERLFLRGTLDKLGITMEVAARHEYKSASEQFTEHGFSGPAREAMTRLAESVSEQLTEAVARRAKIDNDDAGRLVNSGPFSAEQALGAGLVDALGYRDEVYAAVRKQVGATEDTALLYLGRYQRYKELNSRLRQLPASRQDAVALIHAVGVIRHGRNGRGSPLTGGSAMGSDSITATLRSATADSHIKAILLRVNSPGGTYVASDTIWREVVRARDAGKPVVVSMSDVAASGGYFISMAADAIVAQPGTITGSIGVIASKPVLSEAYSKAGITTDSVEIGKHARMFSFAHSFTDDEWALVDAWLDRVYADFTGKVAAGRGMTAEQVHEVARGRVWTGADASSHGLVDELGGIDEAAAIARRLAGLPATAPLVPFPRLGPLDRVRPATNSEDRRAAVGTLAAAHDPAFALTAAPLAVAAGLGSGQPSDLALAALAGPGLFAECWGPVWQAAASCGLPAWGPLMLPGSWTFH